ncbi:MAG: helix-turn-helix transcriptional regulator [Mesorhizobium sp.]|nr:S24 family peptidase [Mesorhizobium sp.]MBN9243966.1 helix-turn-helix transcriptional regulator [Mesorhizobium sp.]
MASQLSINNLAVLPISHIADLARNAQMVDLTKRYEHYATRMKAFMEARNITGEMAADMIGAHPTTIYDLRRGAQRLDDEWRVKVAAGFKTEEAVLFGEGPLPTPHATEIFPAKKRGRKPKIAANDNLPLYGLAAGSAMGAHRMSNDPIDEVPCPAGLRDVIGAYALLTRGESMVPRYFPGDRLYINPVQRVRPGDHVIIQTRLHDSSGTETWVKRYDGETESEIRVWQYNPPAEMKFKKQYVMHVHRVLPVNELF